MDYINSNFPLLWQFILTNTAWFDFATFADSMVGGDLNDATGFRKEYLNGDLLKAGYVNYSKQGLVKRSEDLTLPVAWAMGLRTEIDQER